MRSCQLRETTSIARTFVFPRVRHFACLTHAKCHHLPRKQPWRFPLGRPRMLELHDARWYIACALATASSIPFLQPTFTSAQATTVEGKLWELPSTDVWPLTIWPCPQLKRFVRHLATLWRPSMMPYPKLCGWWYTRITFLNAMPLKLIYLQQFNWS